MVQVTFAYAAGPLAWSVVAFRNSLVFHSLDKVQHAASPSTVCRLVSCTSHIHVVINCLKLSAAIAALVRMHLHTLCVHGF